MMMKKLDDRYSAATTANRIAVMTTLLNTKYDGTPDMGEYLSEMEGHFSMVDTMDLSVENCIQVPILLVSVSSVDSLSSTVSAIKTQ